MTRIAIDAMGGDNAPGAVVEGAVKAVERGDVAPDDLVLIGPQDTLRAMLAKQASGGIHIEDAGQVVEMNENPVDALRKKRDSSIAKGIYLLRLQQVDAMISAGNTGAMVAYATLRLGMLPGVKRPGIAVLAHSLSGACTIIDVGANIHCKPIHLFHYGVMAANYMRCVLNLDNPRIALINIGEETEKGTSLLKETRDLFDSSGANFIGNIEGQDLFSGKCDVLVCDGFVGNVILKVSEGLGAYVYNALLSELKGSMESGSRGILPRGMLDELYKKMDYSEYGGAPLLGVNGNVFICHGRSDAKAIANAIRSARRSVENNLMANIAAGLGG